MSMMLQTPMEMMPVPVESIPRGLTPQELLRLPQAKTCELVNGILREKSMGAKSDLAVQNLVGMLIAYLNANPVGYVFGASTGYQCFPSDPGMLRKPDASFVRVGRLPHEEAPGGWIMIPPDLAIESVSPHDTFDEVDSKIDEYLEAGVRLVWVLAAENRTVLVVRANGNTTRLHENHELDGEDVLPGFRCPIAPLFRRPGASQ